MKWVPFILYVIVLIISLFLPTSEDYNTIFWKLLIGQAYAIPAFLIGFLFIFLFKKQRS